MRRRKDLEAENEELNRQLIKLMSEYDWLKTKLDIIKSYTEEYPTPKECINGPWCKTCAFVKPFRVGPAYTDDTRIYVCGKGEVCKGYVSKMEV